MARLRAIVRPETAIDPQASAAHPRHFPGQKLRLGGDALGADPTYLLYLPSRSRGGLRRIDFGAWPRRAASPRQVSPTREITIEPSCTSDGGGAGKIETGRLGWSPRRTKRSDDAAGTYGQYQNARSTQPHRADRSGAAVQPGNARDARRRLRAVRRRRRSSGARAMPYTEAHLLGEPGRTACLAKRSGRMVPPCHQ